MTGGRPTFVVGDIHGELEKLNGLLQHAALIDSKRQWCGKDASLWFTGDFFDRGPDGIGVVELIMRLQLEAAVAGGDVGALLGNHEVLLLAAHRFGDSTDGWSYTFRSHWERAGGQRTDIEQLGSTHIEWLQQLPAMALVAGRLLMHADAMFYVKYGRGIDQVNQAITNVLQSDDIVLWDVLLDSFAQRMAFISSPINNIDPASQFLASQTLQQFGGQQIIHGHTPIFMLKHVRPAAIHQPLVYASGLCVNIDGAMCAGGPGFVYQLPPLETFPAQPRRYGRRKRR